MCRAWGRVYIGIMERKTQTAIGFGSGLYKDYGKENGNHCSMIGYICRGYAMRGSNAQAFAAGKTAGLQKQICTRIFNWF